MGRPPVILLALDTSDRSQRRGVLASGRGEVLRAVTEDDPAVGVVTLIDGLIQGVPAGAMVDGVVVVTGPGSFTGVRVGMAAGLGLAHARRLPLYGVGALEVVAYGAGKAAPSRIVAVADAGRGGVYAAGFDRCEGGWVAVGVPWRTTLTAFTGVPGAGPVGRAWRVTEGAEGAEATAPLTALTGTDMIVGLASSAVAAVRRGPIAYAGLRATYAGDGSFAAVPGRL